MLKHYVEYFYPGVLVSETEVKEISRRDRRCVKPSKLCYGFQFFDREEVIKDGETLRGNRKNLSGMYYIGGEVLTVEDVEALRPKSQYKILLSNMVNNGWDKVIRTRLGNFQNFYPKDKVV